MQTQYLTCACTKTGWSIAGHLPGRHLVCYCKDCQSFPRHTGQPGMLDAQGGSHIWQTVPAALAINRGAENLRCLRLSPKGLNRWYAGCCGTPIANTLQKPTLPFVGALMPAPGEGFGPVMGHVNTVSTKGAVKEHGFETAGLTLILRAIGSIFSGTNRGPFFDENGQPPVAPQVLTLAERNAARGGPLG